jgi:hypothetical protein
MIAEYPWLIEQDCEIKTQTPSNQLYFKAATTNRYTDDSTINKGLRMAKGQQKSNKESKKPKKDTSAPKPVALDTERPRAITTTIIPRGKKPV